SQGILQPARFVESVTQLTDNKGGGYTPPLIEQDKASPPVGGEEMGHVGFLIREIAALSSNVR
ncbi:MAG: hypothetical protein OEV11_11380, partial [Deltaproteobacteria bacterium]|nr:hypothetical protein [Deltaproteobacteria bacterium]